MVVRRHPSFPHFSFLFVFSFSFSHYHSRPLSLSRSNPSVPLFLSLSQDKTRQDLCRVSSPSTLARLALCFTLCCLFFVVLSVRRLLALACPYLGGRAKFGPISLSTVSCINSFGELQTYSGGWHTALKALSSIKIAQSLPMFSRLAPIQSRVLPTVETISLLSFSLSCKTRQHGAVHSNEGQPSELCLSLFLSLSLFIQSGPWFSRELDKAHQNNHNSNHFESV